ncbi:MAG: HIT family protein [Parcubacteria group bacterium]|nr:HIT family protein [Parcubacteria group bacterium]
MIDCLFCKITKGEIPSTKIYEDEKFLAFLDINPVNVGHTLIIPKEHYEDAASTPDEVLSELIVRGKKIGKALIEGLGAEGFNLTTNNGKAAGQVIPHVHFHIIPRKSDDGLVHWRPKKYKDGEEEEVAGKIKGVLN